MLSYYNCQYVLDTGYNRHKIRTLATQIHFKEKKLYRLPNRAEQHYKKRTTTVFREPDREVYLLKPSKKSGEKLVFSSRTEIATLRFVFFLAFLRSKNFQE